MKNKFNDDIVEAISTILTVFIAVGLIATLFVGILKLIIWIWSV